jgi:pyruvate dehydrogenase E2 component (dihydrolipoamide acetyltransferase)
MSVSKVVLAKLSPTMEEGTIVRWAKNEGDPVKVGDVLAEIETDKANMEMEALGAGVLRKILVPAGGKAPVGALIGVVAEPGEDIAPLLAKAASSPPPAAAAAGATDKAASAEPPAPTTEAGTTPAATPTPAASEPQPAAAAPAPVAPAPVAPAAPAAVADRPSPAPAPGPVAEGGRVKASPLARSMAAQQNIPLESVSGSGPGGRIIKRDIEAWTGGREAAPEAAVARPSAAPAIAAGQELPLSNMRKTIARRLAESMFTAPHFYVTVEIDMGPAVALREQVLHAAEAKVSYNDLVVKACARALTRFPMVNASWAGDKIVTHGEVHVGVAVAIPDGLITPVVRNADRKSILAISGEVKDLAGRARERKLKPEEFVGSTFTISNLGMMDVTEFTAIINPPESAILAVGSVRKVPVVVDDAVSVGHRMKVTLSCDHRVVDGALGASFLQEVRRLLENPIALLV